MALYFFVIVNLFLTNLSQFNVKPLSFSNTPYSKQVPVITVTFTMPVSYTCRFYAWVKTYSRHVQVENTIDRRLNTKQKLKRMVPFLVPVPSGSCIWNGWHTKNDCGLPLPIHDIATLTAHVPPHTHTHTHIIHIPHQLEFVHRC